MRPQTKAPGLCEDASNSPQFKLLDHSSPSPFQSVGPTPRSSHPLNSLFPSLQILLSILITFPCCFPAQITFFESPSVSHHPVFPITEISLLSDPPSPLRNQTLSGVPSPPSAGSQQVPGPALRSQKPHATLQAWGREAGKPPGRKGPSGTGLGKSGWKAAGWKRTFGCWSTAG